MQCNAMQTKHQFDVVLQTHNVCFTTSLRSNPQASHMSSQYQIRHFIKGTVCWLSSRHHQIPQIPYIKSHADITLTMFSTAALMSSRMRVVLTRTSCMENSFLAKSLNPSSVSVHNHNWTFPNPCMPLYQITFQPDRNEPTCPQFIAWKQRVLLRVARFQFWKYEAVFKLVLQIKDNENLTFFNVPSAVFYMVLWVILLGIQTFGRGLNLHTSTIKLMVWTVGLFHEFNQWISKLIVGRV